MSKTANQKHILLNGRIRWKTKPKYVLKQLMDYDALSSLDKHGI